MTFCSVSAEIFLLGVKWPGHEINHISSSVRVEN